MRTKKALISVFDKSGIVDFAKSLNSMGWEIISTGGTSKILKEEGIQVKDIADHDKISGMFRRKSENVASQCRRGYFGNQGQWKT